MALNMIFLLATCVEIQRIQENKKQRKVSRTKLIKLNKRKSYKGYYNTVFSLNSKGKITYRILSLWKYFLVEFYVLVIS